MGCSVPLELLHFALGAGEVAHGAVDQRQPVASDFVLGRQPHRGFQMTASFFRVLELMKHAPEGDAPQTEIRAMSDRLFEKLSRRVEPRALAKDLSGFIGRQGVRRVGLQLFLEFVERVILRAGGAGARLNGARDAVVKAGSAGLLGQNLAVLDDGQLIIPLAVERLGGGLTAPNRVGSDIDKSPHRGRRHVGMKAAGVIQDLRIVGGKGRKAWP